VDRRITNAGVGNETTAQIQSRLDHVLEIAKPTEVVIEAGINDLKAIPLMPGREGKIIDECVANLLDLAKRCRTRGAKVLLLSVLPVGKVERTRRLVWSDAVDRAVSEVNQRLAKQCVGDTLMQFLDLTDQVSGESDYADMLHFNPEFYTRIMPLVRSRIGLIPLGNP